MEVQLTNYGGIVTSIKIPDKNGKVDEVIMGFDSIEDYLKEHPFFGAICGRYANRIAKGRFSLDGITYNLAINNEPNSLHGGIKGFDKVIWESAEIKAKDKVGVLLSYLSKDGEEGYPGNLQVDVFYILDNNNTFSILYSAKTDKTTVVNLTNHCYFNLAGCDKPIYDLLLSINADKITEFDDTNIPTGKFVDVKGTPFDFRDPIKIGEQIRKTSNGFDHNYVLNNSNDKTIKCMATLYDPISGRYMEVHTTEPGIQFYSANYLDGTLKGHNGIEYKKHHALCLETQHFPDSPNHPHFPSTILKPGETYFQFTQYIFKVKK